MSEENVEIVRRVYEEVSAGMWRAPPELFDSDYVVDLTEAAPDVGVVRGTEAAEAALHGYSETFEDFRIELEEVIHADESCVVAAVRDGGRLKGSDSVVWSHFFHVWTFRDGKILSRSAHVERAHALEAAGLSE
jgi:ketosteroid isomerase-like protein